MNELTHHLTARVAAARASLALARRVDDDYAVTVHEGELDSLLRLAEANGVVVADEPGDLDLDQRESA